MWLVVMADTQGDPRDVWARGQGEALALAGEETGRLGGPVSLAWGPAAATELGAGVAGLAGGGARQFEDLGRAFGTGVQEVWRHSGARPSGS